MNRFRFSRSSLDAPALRAELADPACGGYASFEGLVRNHNEGQQVGHLEYEAFEPLAVKEGERIIAEAIAKYGVEHAACVHRIGDLAIGDMAVWVGVSSRHRGEAFLACRYMTTASPTGSRTGTTTASPAAPRARTTTAATRTTMTTTFTYAPPCRTTRAR